MPIKSHNGIMSRCHFHGCPSTEYYHGMHKIMGGLVQHVLELNCGQDFNASMHSIVWGYEVDDGKIE